MESNCPRMIFCASCDIRWQCHPVGILKRLQINGGLCKSCYWRFLDTLKHNRTYSFKNPNIISNDIIHHKRTETLFFSISETTTWPEFCIREYKTIIARLLLRVDNIPAQIIVQHLKNALNSRPEEFHWLTGKQRHIRRMQHEDEMLSRIKWCLDQNLIPAHDHVHLSKGDDRQFMFGVCPWTENGDIQKNGVAYGRASDLRICKELQLSESVTQTTEIESKRGEKQSVQVKKMMKAASGCRKITSYGGL